MVHADDDTDNDTLIFYITDRLGIQVQLFKKAARIFFSKESVLTKCLSNIHYTIARNKKCFRDQIALDEFFPAKFLFTIDQRVQRWLKSCEQAENSQNEVNNRCLDLNNIIDAVLNGTFHSTLPPAFTKVNASESAEKKEPDGKHKGGEGKEGKGRKKRKSKDGKGNSVKNTMQPDEFKLTASKNWNEHFCGYPPPQSACVGGEGLNVCKVASQRRLLQQLLASD
jgi:hypothetical protein